MTEDEIVNEERQDTNRWAIRDKLALSDHHWQWFVTLCPPYSFNKNPKGFRLEVDRFFKALSTAHAIRIAGFGILVSSPGKPPHCHVLLTSFQANGSPSLEEIDHRSVFGTWRTQIEKRLEGKASSEDALKAWIYRGEITTNNQWTQEHVVNYLTGYRNLGLDGRQATYSSVFWINKRHLNKARTVLNALRAPISKTTSRTPSGATIARNKRTQAFLTLSDRRYES